MQMTREIYTIKDATRLVLKMVHEQIDTDYREISRLAGLILEHERKQNDLRDFRFHVLQEAENGFAHIYCNQQARKVTR